MPTNQQNSFEELKTIIGRLLKSYKAKPPEQADALWLNEIFDAEIPELPREERETAAGDIAVSIAAYSEKRESMRRAEKAGMSRESWLAREAKSSAQGMNVREYGEYLSKIDEAIRVANEDMVKTVMTAGGTVNQNPNLDGYIFESEHAGRFNMDAGLKNESVRAKVLRPEKGEGYAKNSPDIAVIDQKGQAAQEIQAKCYQDAAASNGAFEDGQYGDQTHLVPEGHENKGSTSVIKEGDVKSRPVSKEDVKKVQEEVQETGHIPEKSWNDYTTSELALEMGKQAGKAGLIGAAFGGAAHVAQRLINDEEIEGDELALEALKAGAQSGATCAVAGAMKVYLEKTSTLASSLVVPTTAKIPIGVPVFNSLRGNPVAIGMVASVAVDGACIAYRVATGEMSAEEACLEVERTAGAVVAGTITAAKGAAIGATIGTVFGPVGTSIGSFVGGTIGYVAGSTAVQKIIEGGQKLRSAAFEKIKPITEKFTSVVSTAVETFNNCGRFVRNLFSL